MILTKESLERIIKEELRNLMNEGNQDETLRIIGAALRKALPGRELTTRKHKKIPTVIVIQTASEALAEVDPEGTAAVYPVIYDNEELMSKVQAAAKGIQINTSYGELGQVINEVSRDPEYQEEYDLVANNIKTQPGFLEFAMRSLEDSYGNRFYNHGKARIGFYLTLLGQHAREGQDSYGGTVEGHIASIESKLAEHPDLLTPAGRGRLDALLDHLKQSY